MNLNLIHPEMNICSYEDCTTAFCVIVIGGDIYCKRHAIDALCGVELAALRARVWELELERDELKTMCVKAYFDIYGGVRFEIYNAIGDELSELYDAALAKGAK